MRAKLIEIYGQDTGSDDYSDIKYFYPEDTISLFEEVTKEELDILKKWVEEQNNHRYDTKLVLAIESRKTIKVGIKEAIELAKQEEIKKQERIQKRAEAEKKKQEKAEEKRKKAERKLFK